MEKVSEDVKVFTEQEYLVKAEFAVRDFYEHFKERLINLDDNIPLNPGKHVIDHKIGGNNFCDVVILGKSLKVTLNVKGMN